MTQKEKLVAAPQKRKSNKEWIAWTLFGVFIVGAIGLMLVGDYYYAPEPKNPAELQDAVGK